MEENKELIAEETSEQNAENVKKPLSMTKKAIILPIVVVILGILVFFDIAVELIYGTASGTRMRAANATATSMVKSFNGIYYEYTEFNLDPEFRQFPVEGEHIIKGVWADSRNMHILKIDSENVDTIYQNDYMDGDTGQYWAVYVSDGVAMKAWVSKHELQDDELRQYTEQEQRGQMRKVLPLPNIVGFFLHGAIDDRKLVGQCHAEPKQPTTEAPEIEWQPLPPHSNAE